MISRSKNGKSRAIQKTHETRVPPPPILSKAHKEILMKMYVTNVANRLRELGTPSDSDLRRWVYELLQNAKDSISNDPSRDGVDMSITTTLNTVEFKHNGSPFTAKSLLGLLYKYSEGKRSGESIGRFGTGFLTTHCLSKVISISGDMYTTHDNTSAVGFSLKMFRDGDGPHELAEGLRKMEESRQYTAETSGWTKFTYHLSSDLNQRAMKKGLASLKTNALLTMLFCPRIKSLKLNECGKPVRFMKLQTVAINDQLQSTDFVMETDVRTMRRFVHASIERPNEKLSEKYKTNRRLRLTVVVEVDAENQLVKQSDKTPSHFCDFPLIGSEKHVMPVIINSPDFEPDSERVGLILDGPDLDFETQKITEAGINRLILLETIPLFQEIVSFLAASHHNLHFLLRGLSSIPSLPTFDREWFKTQIVKPYRDILIQFAIVETEVCRRKISSEVLKTEDLLAAKQEARVLFVRDDDEDGTLYDLYRDYFGPACLSIKAVNATWVEYIWDECGVCGLGELCAMIQTIESADQLQMDQESRREPFEWLNDIFQYILKSEKQELLESMQLIPNENQYFISLNDPEIADGKELTPFALDVLKDLGEDLRAVLVHHSITALDSVLQVKWTPADLGHRIHSRVEDLITESQNKINSFDEITDAIWPLLKIVPNSDDYDSEFLARQQSAFSLVATFRGKLSNPIVNNDLDIVAWQSTHIWCRHALICVVSDLKTIDDLGKIVKDPVDWLNQLYDYLQKEVDSLTLDAAAIVPDQTGTFQTRPRLSNDQIHDIFKTPPFEEEGLKLREILVFPGITTIGLSQTKTLRDVGELIAKLFTEQTSPPQRQRGFMSGPTRPDTRQVVKWRLALLLVHVLPCMSASAHKTNARLLNLVTELFPADVAGMEKTVLAEDVPPAWHMPNVICLKQVISRVAELASLNELTTKVAEPIQFLNHLFSLVKRFHIDKPGRIYPNERGKFGRHCDLKHGTGIPDELKDALLQLSQTDVRAKLIDKRCKPKQQLVKMKLREVCSDIDACVKRIYEDSTQHQNPIYRKVLATLNAKWIEADLEKAAELFPYFALNKGWIVCQVILDEASRNWLAQLAPYSDEDLKALSTESFEFQSFEQLEAEAHELEAKLEQLNEEERWTAAAIQERVDSGLTTIEKELEGLLRYKFADCFPPGTDMSDIARCAAEYFDTSRKKDIGYLGEAAVFKDLRDSGKFEKVIWPNHSESKDGHPLCSGNEIFFIKETGRHYDIEVITRNFTHIFIEVKSTYRHISDGRVGHHLGQDQLHLFASSTAEKQCVLALVFKAESEQPDIHYFSIGPFHQE
jgi:hypothetical protein